MSSKFIDWLIADVPPPDRSSVDRRRVLAVGAFISAAVASGFFVQRLLIEPGLGLRHANIAAACVLLWSIPFVMKVTRRYRLAAHLLVAVLSLAIMADCALYGSLAQPPVIGFLITPLMAAFYLGPTATASCGGAMALSAVGLVVLERHQMLPPRVDVPPEMWLGSVTGLIVFLVFVMRIYEAERDSQMRQTRAILDNLSDGVAGVSATGVIESVNPSFLRTLGLESDVVGSHVDSLPSPWGPAGLEAAGGGQTVHATGEQSGRVVAFAASPYPGGMVLVARDVTHETEVDRMKTEFTSVVSHELRTPLASVLGFAKIIQKRLSRHILPLIDTDDAKVNKAVAQVTGNLGTIVTEGERLGALIDDILDIAKMEAGQMSWRREPISPGDVVQRAVEATGALFDGEVQLVTEVSSDLPTIVADPARLHQLLINFISNAAKFVVEGEVVVATDVVDGAVEFSVSDTGPGIAADQLASIFEKFRQSEGRVDGPRGTGLGLAICREIAVAHGGSVDVSSEVGEGSRFTARIPIELVPGSRDDAVAVD